MRQLVVDIEAIPDSTHVLVTARYQGEKGLYQSCTYESESGIRSTRQAVDDVLSLIQEKDLDIRG